VGKDIKKDEISLLISRKNSSKKRGCDHFFSISNKVRKRKNLLKIYRRATKLVKGLEDMSYEK